MLNTTEIFNRIQSTVDASSVPPIVIPSWGRPDSKLIKRCVDEGVNAYVFTGADQLESYSKVIGDSTTVKLIESVEGIIPKRNFVNAEMYRLGYEHIIVMDDDITLLSYLIPGQTKKGDYKAAKVNISLLEMQKMFKYYTDMKPDYSMMGMSHDASSHFVQLDKIEEITAFGMIMQLVCINLKVVNETGATYKADGWDDFDFMLQCINSGHATYKIEWLSEASPSIIKGASVCYGNDMMTKFEKYYNLSTKLQNKWGSKYVRLEMVRDFPNNRFNWSSIKEDFYANGSLNNRVENKPIDYVVVGAGISGATIARKLAEAGKQILVLEKETTVGGLCRDKKTKDFYTQQFGPHIFHTDFDDVYKFISQYTTLTDYKHRVKVDVSFDGSTSEYINLPTNMADLIGAGFVNTFGKNEVSLKELKDSGISDYIAFADYVYNNVIKNYSFKQWRQDLTVDDARVDRIKVRVNAGDYNYFRDKYQGMPNKGFSKMIASMLKHDSIEVVTNFNFNEKGIVDVASTKVIAPFIAGRDCKNAQIIYTGYVEDIPDATLYVKAPEYVKTKFDIISEKSIPGTPACINYPNKFLYTRRTDFRKFYNKVDGEEDTVVCYEYPHSDDGVRCYPNPEYYSTYTEMINSINCIYDNRFIFLGRFGQFKYLDIDDSVKEALNLFEKLSEVELNA